MRQRYTLFLIFLLSALSCYTQQYQFELSATAGPGFACIWGAPAKNEFKEQQLIPSFHAGIGLQFNARKIFSLRTGVFVERKGFTLPISSFDKDGNTVIYKYQSKYNYVTIPLLLRFSIGKRIQFFAQAGGFVSALFRSHIQLKELGLNQINPSGYRYVDAGFSGGLGLKGYITPRLSLSFEVINNTGFMPIIKNTQNKEQHLKNNSTNFLFSIGYAFIEWKPKKNAK